eukprot:GFUD01001253.1.p1 GENE.GFUD01001253.1~~GFUD01001253.1.p1  ORF type:complete len:711 (-),score=193.25 GFUD01001253.1:100-2232(-)
MAQDFGTEFQFSTDKNALQSILNNRGVSYAQTLAVSQESRPSMTPARNIPDSFKKTDQLEFFESKAGQIFFRKKVVGKKDHTPNRNPVSGKKGGFGRSFRDLEGDYGLPKRMNYSNTKAGKFRTPLANKNENRMGVRPPALSDKKPTLLIPPIHRQSISERKPAPPPTGLPVPNHSTLARKMLFNKPKPVPDHHKPKPVVDHHKPKLVPDHHKPTAEVDHQFTRPSNILPPLTKLTRESLRQIPRESLAWMAQLPRESATFAELEKLMTDDDKRFANDDNTDSFEAIERRMKTPSKVKLVGAVPKRVIKNKENIPSLVVEVEKDQTALFQSEEVVQKDEIKQTPPVEKPKLYKKKHEMFGHYMPEGSSLTNLSPVDVASYISVETKATSAPSTPVKSSTPTSPLHNSAPQTPILSQPSITIGTPLTPGIRSLSTTDLSTSGMVQVSRSASVSNMAEVVFLSDLVPADQVEGLLGSLTEYQEQLVKFREEQDELAKQEEDLMRKIKERKQQFRELFGVSPLRINTKRTVLPVRPFKLADMEEFKESPVTESKKAIPHNNDSLALTPTIFINTEIPPDTARRVRFNSGNNQTKNLTPKCTSEFSPLCSPLSSLNNSAVSDIRCSSTNQSFASLKSSFSFLQTPLPPKKRLNHNFDEVDQMEVPNLKQLVEPTPVALKKLSDRVKAEFAALYADSSDDTDTEAPEKVQTKLSF